MDSVLESYRNLVSAIDKLKIHPDNPGYKSLVTKRRKAFNTVCADLGLDPGKEYDRLSCSSLIVLPKDKIRDRADHVAKNRVYTVPQYLDIDGYSVKIKLGVAYVFNVPLFYLTGDGDLTDIDITDQSVDQEMFEQLQRKIKPLLVSAIKRLEVKLSVYDQAVLGMIPEQQIECARADQFARLEFDHDVIAKKRSLKPKTVLSAEEQIERKKKSEAIKASKRKEAFLFVKKMQGK